MYMAIKLKVPYELAQQAIQEKISELKNRKELQFSGKTYKIQYGSTYVLNTISPILVHCFKEHKPLNESFEFNGLSKLTFILENKESNTVNNTYSDGIDYIVRGNVTLKDEDGYIAVVLEDNKIEITDIEA